MIIAKETPDLTITYNNRLQANEIKLGWAELHAELRL